MTWTAGNLQVGSGATLRNLSTGTINFQTVTSAADGTAVVGLTDPNNNTELLVVVNTTTLTDYAAVETFCNTTIDAVVTNAANDELMILPPVAGG